MSISSAKILFAFRERVKEERKKNSITQNQLAEYAGISVDTVKRIENGKGVKLDVAYNIAAALGVPFESLLPPQKYLSDDEIVRRAYDAQQTLQILLEEKLHKK